MKKEIQTCTPTEIQDMITGRKKICQPGTEWKNWEFNLLNLICTLDGECTLRENGRCFSLTQGSIVLLKPVRERHFLVPERWDALWFNFNTNLPVEWKEVPGYSEIFWFQPEPDSPCWRRCCAALKEAYHVAREHEYQWNVLAKNLAESVILFGNRYYKQNPDGKTINNSTAKIRKLLDGGERLTQKELAAKFGLSRSDLYRKFRMDTGMTPTQYAEEIRMRHILALMADPTLNSRADVTMSAY